MPIHDWSRLKAGLFRDFHNRWYSELSKLMNERLLPPDYYALIEQNAGDNLTDVLTLHHPNGLGGGTYEIPPGCEPIAVAEMPPRVKTQLALPRDYQIPADKQLRIRHVTNDRVVAIIEIVSEGNKSSRGEFERFVVKSAETIRLGIHLLVIDLHPPTSRDPQGIHGAIVAQMGDHSYQAPTDKPLTLASYVAMPIGTAYVEPMAVGDVLPEMPLFLDEGHYVNMPLEATYMAAFQGVPRRWKTELLGSSEG